MNDTSGEPGTDEYGPGGPAERPHEPILNLPGVVIGLIGICSAIHILRSYVLGPQADFEIVVRFAFVPVRYSGEYVIDIYALLGPVTYAFLHGSLVHLAVNMVWLAAFGSPLANRIGAWRFVVFWVVTSLAAVALHYVLHPVDAVPLVGASGAISGMMGAAARYGFRVDRSVRRPLFGGNVLPFRQVLTNRTVVAFLAVWFAINILMGFGFATPAGDARIAWEAHIGGFLAGFLLARLFDRPAQARI